MSIIISIYNNKGGVGKTTLSWNIAHSIAAKGYRVLTVDFDPQCNLSIAILGQTDFTSKLPQQNIPYGTTIRSYLQRFIQNSTTRELFVHKGQFTHQNVELVAGDFWVNIYSESLNVGADLLSGTGISKYSIIKEIVDKANDQAAIPYDYVLVDLPPSFGSLVRTAYYSSNYFIIPCTSDTYSAYCISLIGQMFPSFSDDWKVGVRRYNNANPDLHTYDNIGHPKFAGWIFNGFDRRSGKYIKADAAHCDNIKRHINDHIVSNDGIIKANNLPPDSLVGEIEDMNVLVQEGILQSRPIIELRHTKPSNMMQSKHSWSQNQLKLMEDLQIRFNAVADNIITICT